MYQVVIRQSAVKELRKLTSEHRQRISAAIDALVTNPRPHGAKKMSGVDAWRIRVGDYRVVYQVKDTQLIVEVIRVAHRREVYR